MKLNVFDQSYLKLNKFTSDEIAFLKAGNDTGQ